MYQSYYARKAPKCSISNRIGIMGKSGRRKSRGSSKVLEQEQWKEWKKEREQDRGKQGTDKNGSIGRIRKAGLIREK